MTMTDPFVHPGVGADGPPALEPALDLPADRTLKDSVLTELKRTITHRDVTLAVPDRPGWSVDFASDLNADLMRRWSKQATHVDPETKLPDTDLFELALLTIAGQCRGIRKDGELLNVDGAKVTFTSPLMVEAYGSPDVRVTVREFYGADSVVVGVFTRLQEESQAGSLDPTTESSD